LELRWPNILIEEFNGTAISNRLGDTQVAASCPRKSLNTQNKFMIITSE